MSIDNGHLKYKRHIKQSDGSYKLVSQWTSSDTVHMEDGTTLTDEVKAIESQIGEKASTDSPIFTGTPEAPTAVNGTNTTQIATTAFVQGEINNLVNGAPETLNTLNELAEAIEDHKDVTDALNAAIGNKVDKVSGKGLSTNDYTTDEKNKLAGIAAGANAYTHPNSGVTAGTYRSVTVNAAGHVTAGSNPTVTIAQGGTGATTVAGVTENLFKTNVTSPAYLFTLPSTGWTGGYSTMAQLKTALGLGTAAYTASTAYATSGHTHSNYLTGITKTMVTNALGYTPPTTNTTYGAATTSANGLMTAAMVTKLNGIAAGATAFDGTWGVAPNDSNSRYFKFTDGTLICVKRVTIDSAMTTAWGTLYETPEISLGTWAYSFASEPIVSITAYSHNSSATENKKFSFPEGVKGITTTSAGSTCLARATSTAKCTYWVSVIGIGRWK